jgi:hypothetical protein
VDYRVIGDSQLIEGLEELPDVHVMLDHSSRVLVGAGEDPTGSVS